jgi:hypothetical protein
MNESTLMTVPDFARAVSVTTACIRRWVWERRVASVKLGRCVRIPATEAARIIDAGMRPAKQRTRRVSL